MNLATEPKKPIIIPQLAAAAKFGGFAKETGQDVRQPDVKKDTKLEAIIQAWKACKFDWSSPITIDEHYEIWAGLTKRINLSSCDIERFCIALAQFQEEKDFRNKAGFFLSGLANHCQDHDVIIRTSHLFKRVNFLGYKNSRNITVEGDVGDGIGILMHDGMLVVNGDALQAAGDGLIGGKLVINGFAGHGVGVRMRNGEIHLESDYENLQFIPEGGKIFHKGQLIWPTGGGSE
jgi:hypothetical protein